MMGIVYSSLWVIIIGLSLTIWGEKISAPLMYFIGFLSGIISMILLGAL